MKLVRMLVVIAVVGTMVTAQERKPVPLGPGDCSHVTWNAICSIVGDCVYHSSPGVGCNVFGGCNNCYRGLAQPLDKSVKELAFDPQTQFTGRFIRSRFVVDHPGPLEGIGIRKGMVIDKINYWRVTERRMKNLIYRKHAAMQFEFRKQKSGWRMSAILRPVE